MASMIGRKGTARTFVALAGCAALALALAPRGAVAGSLTPTAAPTATGSAMYTLENIYQRLYDGTAGAKRTGAFTEPTDLGATMHTLDDIMLLAPVMDNITGAAAADVCSGKKFWGLRGEPGGWGRGPGGSGVVGTGPCAPLFTDPFGPYSIDENTAGVLGTLSVHSTGTVAWSIVPPVSGFSINASGQLSVTSGLDFETARSHTLTIQASQGGSYHQLKVVVNVNDANDSAPVFTASGPFGIAEGTTAVRDVGSVAASDADTVGTLSFSITTTGAPFTITSAGLIKTSAALDYETNPGYTFTVRVSDGASPTPHTADASVTVAVTNINDSAPVIAPTNPSFSVQENVAVGTRVGAVTATDADGSALGYSITAGNTATTFAIDSATGQITVATSPNRETTASYSLTVQVSDGSANATTTVAVTILDVNEAPTVATNTGISFALGGATTNTLTTSHLSVDDVDSTTAQVMYVVTQVPALVSLQVKDSGGTWQTLVKDRSFFTQADLANNDVRLLEGSTSGADSFQFYVLDGEGAVVGHTTPYTFTITVN